jgi:hypothetical protein
VARQREQLRALREAVLASVNSERATGWPAKLER